MSNAFDNWTNEEAPPAPFWRPFPLAILLGLPASAIWYAGAVHAHTVASIVTIIAGALCGLGTRLAGGEYFSAFLATLLHIVVTLTLITATLLADHYQVPLTTILAELMSWDKIAPFCNACVEAVGKTFVAYPIAFLAAYKVQDRDEI